MIAFIMKVFKNLFGRGDKIHVDEIAVAPGLLLGGAVIVDSGSGVDGSWVKWGNGYARCWKNDIIVDLSGLSAWGYVDYRWDYPVEFVGLSAAPTAMARGSGGLSGNVNVTFSGAGGASLNDYITLRVCLMNKTSTQSECYVAVKAEGWWKEPGT